MIRSFLKDRILLFLLAAAILLKLLSLNESAVERYYSTGFYPLISGAARWLLGWVPFSVGDVLYAAAGLWLAAKVWKFLRLLFTKKLKGHLSANIFWKYFRLSLAIYIVFNLFWGLNYNRQGIARQLDLPISTFRQEELGELTCTLFERLEHYAHLADSVKRERYNNNDTLFSQAVADYRNMGQKHTFLAYRFPSVKASLYGASGKYFGYTGYYNPFTGEAQLKTTIPVFLKPFVINHEIAHQLGYAKEMEASFVSYLVGKNSESIEVRYSVYYDMFFEAWYQWVSPQNYYEAVGLLKALPARVKNDRRSYRQYLEQSKNAVEPFMSGAYDRYLRLNNQPKGKETYSEVITWLLAYGKKYGKKAI